MASKVIPHFALCGGNDDCLGSREGEKKGKKRKGVNKAARRTKASETHTHQQWHHHRRGEAADQREWRAASSKAAEPPAAELEHPRQQQQLARRLNPRERLAATVAAVAGAAAAACERRSPCICDKEDPRAAKELTAGPAL